MLEPITREEIFLAKAIGETVPDLEPIIRQEMFLAKIAGMDIATPVPVTREERYLNAIANKEVIDLKPITRREMFLAKAMGADIEVPSPITRIEYYLSQLTGGGGSYEKYSWEGVFASIDKGTYATDYAIGDMIPLDLGSEGLINMQIAAFDTDDLADGSGKAPITWIAKELLNTDHRMNPAVVTNDDGTFQEGTGSTGGWEKCEMRAYLNDTIKPLIPERVRTAIKGIKNTHSSRNINGNFVNTSTSYDEVWIPGSREIYIPGDKYVDPGVYAELFTATGRKKYKNGYTYSSSWWTRDAGNNSMLFTRVDNQGNVLAGNNCNADRAYSICLCFCT